MSVDEINRFNQEAKADEAMVADLKEIGNDLDGLVAYANSKGYQFTAEDVQSSHSGDLSEEDLDQVAGGGGVVGIVVLMVVEIAGAVAVGSG